MAEDLLSWEEIDALGLTEEEQTEWAKILPTLFTDDDPLCKACGKDDFFLVYCDNKACKAAYHVQCLANPPDHLQDIWYCPDCVDPIR